MSTDALVVDVSEDWATACDVQRRFIPRPNSSIELLSYGARCRQVRAVGGDFYDFLPLSHDRLAFAIGDASGKSIGAAIMISSVQSSLRTAAHFAGSETSVVLRTVNSLLETPSPDGRYATLFYGVFDANTRTLRYSNAGHNPPIVIRRDGSTVHLETGGVPVGLFPSRDYREGVEQLRAGDLIIAYTDGITEALNPLGQEWGVEGLLKAAYRSQTQSPDDIACSIFQAMDEFSQGRQIDDATVLVARVR
ncbi:MAG TPA: PP2C family protein-serine/threonine phosphatase [Bryobacteraceae bacterium]|jgi:sigma-B regulation protein RsbU (phosphoserine phosphatase)|nr:PP2C family protein-serine/threonine phosphatase [Bryobacteraceae bacterium]